jgi:hypothetical protein
VGREVREKLKYAELNREKKIRSFKTGVRFYEYKG